MTAVNVFKFGISSPDDVSPLKLLIREGYQPEQIMAVVGKTEGPMQTLGSAARNRPEWLTVGL